MPRRHPHILSPPARAFPLFVPLTQVCYNKIKGYLSRAPESENADRSILIARTEKEKEEAHAYCTGCFPLAYCRASSAPALRIGGWNRFLWPDGRGKGVDKGLGKHTNATGGAHQHYRLHTQSCGQVCLLLYYGAKATQQFSVLVLGFDNLCLW